MPFIQITEYRTSRLEEVDQLGKQWEAAVGSDTIASRRRACRVCPAAGERGRRGPSLTVVVAHLTRSSFRGRDHLPRRVEAASLAPMRSAGLP
jgi:hypothetical protein